MTALEVDYFMNEAIAEGRKALPDCLPNPPVGCVIVSSGVIISRGYTNRPGCHHAEAMALDLMSGHQYNDLTVFVTLEPCSFEGKTPSCAKAIVEKGVNKVYVGLIDPHPKNQGAGLQILRDANVKIEVGILADHIFKELSPYLHL